MGCCTPGLQQDLVDGDSPHCIIVTRLRPPCRMQKYPLVSPSSHLLLVHPYITSCVWDILGTLWPRDSLQHCCHVMCLIPSHSITSPSTAFTLGTEMTLVHLWGHPHGPVDAAPSRRCTAAPPAPAAASGPAAPAAAPSVGCTVPPPCVAVSPPSCAAGLAQ